MEITVYHFKSVSFFHNKPGLYLLLVSKELQGLECLLDCIYQTKVLAVKLEGLLLSFGQVKEVVYQGQ